MTAINRIALLFLVAHYTNAAAQPLEREDEKALLQLYGDEEMIITATGAKKPISKAPSVATVITQEDIKRIGATDLDEVLETVPGLHVSRNTIYGPVYTIRGVYSGQNPQVLVLINNIPITNLFVGDRSRVWGGMPVQGIARVEVVRGPGSAVYGADAFAGVINIITKTKEDIKGTEAGGRVGSFDTYDGWALHGDKWGDFDIAAMLEYHNTNGQRKTIGADAQSFFDQNLHTDASLAPGPVSLERDNLDARLDVSRENWRFHGGLQHRSNIGAGAGVAQALDTHGRYASDRWNADLIYHNPEFTENWDVTAQVSYFNTSQIIQKNLLIYPPGSFDGAFPQGVIGNPEVFERHARASISGFYSGFDWHTFRVGAGFNYDSIYDVQETKNYNFISGSLTPAPLKALINVTQKSELFLTPGNRKNSFLFLQDEWHFAKDWELTAG
ncbi:TonB-dependent receptor plug domain-containing protein, partial [Methylomagnum sp.]